MGSLLALATLVPVVAEERGPSYNLEQLKVMARSAHPTLDAASAAVESSAGMLRQSQAYPNPRIFLGFGRGRPRDGGDSRSENRIELIQVKVVARNPDEVAVEGLAEGDQVSLTEPREESESQT